MLSPVDRACFAHTFLKRIYEDKDLLVLNKPSGLIVNRSGTTKGRFTLQDWLGKNFFSKGFLRETGGEFANRAGLVHRLDKDTSGLILVAKTPDSFSFFKDEFKKRKVEKKYMALVWGELPGKGEITFPLERSFRRGGCPMIVSSSGKLAKTIFWREKSFSLFDGNTTLSLARVKTLTGRTHQIRAHFYYFGFPLFGDKIYGWKSKRQKRIIAKRQSRLFLHAFSLSIKLPRGGVGSFISPLGQDLKDVILSLKEDGFKEEKKIET